MFLCILCGALLFCMKLLIVLQHRFELWNAPAWFPEKLRQDFPAVEVVHLSSYEKLEEHLPDAEVAITWSIRPEQFVLGRNLRWIHSPAAAVHQLMFPALINSSVIVTNAREVHAPVVAEHVLAQVFALAKKIPQAVRWQERHFWGKENMWSEPPRPHEVNGATLALIGLGSIGQKVAKLCSALGMRVLALRQDPQKGTTEGVEQVFAPDRLPQVIAQADYLVIAAPRTPLTEALMNAEQLAKMKPDAFLINVSRGALVDETALADALSSRKIAGAALDVFADEPLPKDSPLWDLQNLLITPHSAAITEKLWDRHYQLIHENLRRYWAGEPLLGVVDKQKGY